MNPDIITEAFRNFLAQKQIVPEQLTPPDALDLMLEFYHAVKFDWVWEDDPYADMILYQYGIYNWSPKDENFELNVTRQLSRAHGPDEDDDDNMFQLGITLFYKPDNYRDVPSFGLWSTASPSIAEYVKTLKKTAGYIRACGEVPSRVEIRTETC